MRALTRDVAGSAGRMLSWWLGELKSMVPAALADRSGSPEAGITIVVKGGRISGTVPSRDWGERDGPSAEAAVLAEISRRSRRSPLRTALLVPLTDCLVRPLEVPASALRDAGKIAALDLERSTPFRSDDVYSAVLAEPARRAGSAALISQLVVKRARVAAVIDQLESAGAKVTAIGCLADDGVTPLPVNFLSKSGTPSPRSSLSLLWSSGVLAALAAALWLGGLAISIMRSETALGELRQAISDVRTRIAETGADEDGASMTEAAAAALTRSKGERLPAVAIIEDLSERLPDTAFVTELRLAEGVVDMAGYGRPAAALAPALERSPFVETATLTAPIVTDALLQKERFSLRLKLTGVSPASGGGPGDGAPETQP